ncbi:hypothetical protein M413DRAFT_445300, partial [Hebeloma cylindrosporum]
MDEPESQPIDIGKGRANEPTEQTPLLGSTSTILDDEPIPPPRQLRRKLTAVFLVSLWICILVFIGGGLLAWSYASRASNLALEDMLVFAGPDRIDVRNMTSDGVVWVNVKGRIGLDVGNVGVWKWVIRSLDKVSVELSTVRISAESELVRVDIPPLDIPLSVDPPDDKSWLAEVERDIRVQLTGNRTVLEEFMRETWSQRMLSVHADVNEVRVAWKRIFKNKMENIRTNIRMKVPIGGGPFPSFDNLVFNVSSSPLTITASATVVNPAPDTLSLTVPSLPFTVSTADKLQLASVSTAPIILTHPNITVHISGSVLSIPAAAFPSLSLLVSRYISGQPNALFISSPLLQQLSEIEVEFPAPNPKPQLLRDVTIRDMKIKPFGGLFLASGVVEGKVVLPKGINIDLDVSNVFPDVLIFDGEVPGDDELFQRGTATHQNRLNDSDTQLPPAPPESPLPSPLPSHAFARVRPDDWLPSLSVRIEPPEDDDAGATYFVSAKVVDVPLEVLPGRQKEFSNFVTKVIFSGEGADAGIQGTAAVVASVDGLPVNESGEIVLQGLPFHGTVHVGKRGL